MTAMPGDEIVYVMLDASTLMHFQRPDQVDWVSILKCQNVSLIVTPTLLRELEEQKVKNRTRKLRERAQALVLWLATFIESDIPSEIRRGVRFAFVPVFPPNQSRGA